MKNIKGFTLVELLVAVSIVIILSAIWFVSYNWLNTSARDTQRKADIWLMKSSLKNYKQERWAYPLPWDFATITNQWDEVAYQWVFDKTVRVNTIDNIPEDHHVKQGLTFFEDNFKGIMPLEIVINTKNKKEALIALNNGVF